MKKGSAKVARKPAVCVGIRFAVGVRGKHYHAMQVGYTIPIHRAEGTTIVREVRPKE